MVTRKPLPQSSDPTDLAPISIPPYPETPTSNQNTSAFRLQDVRGQMATSATDSEPTSANAWVEEGLNKQRTGESQDVPDALRPGPPGYSPRNSQERLRQETNPFLRKHNTGSSQDGNRDSSASVWNEKQSEPSAPPPPVPTTQLSNLSIGESSTNPWQPALDKQQSTVPPIPQLQREPSGNEVWSEAAANKTEESSSSELSRPPALISVPSEPESPAWDEDEPSPNPKELPTNTRKEQAQIDGERNAWDDGASQAPIPVASLHEHPNDAWNLVDHESSGPQQSGVVTDNGEVLPSYAAPDSEVAPALPPRRSQEQPPPQPPRPTIDTTQTSTSSITSPTTRAQKKETYEVKKISWYDVTASNNPRISPILVQNANGPCPLLALVNALTLSTPANIETALVETLRSRERVSLGLLLDAVFDELMSGRRGDAAQELPDVGDLYSFLVTLHTGMNVNPRFLPVSKTSNELRSSMSHVHPSEREAALPGTFEETREMRLYSTFNVPLIHGWLPEKDSTAYTALARSAKSYEDAQNLMFHEESLEEKLQSEGLSFQEQGTLEDIASIKAFFATNATQLTSYGLKTITTALAPGSVAILFRNDHFSTLYRHPDTLQLLQLVTDMGYAGHEEVVWESLIDVNGESAEFFSGDFRVVGGPLGVASTSNSRSSHPSGDGWTTVPSRGRQHDQSQNQLSPDLNEEMVPQSPNTEQEDHDLALALQLQEEEEERHRASTERRRRETELSQQYIEQQANNTSSNVPVRQAPGQAGRGGRGGQPEVRPNIPPRRTGTGVTTSRPVDVEAGSDAPPPSYEQASAGPAYQPPMDHPAHAHASNARPQRRMSAYESNNAGLGRGGRRVSGSTAAGGSGGGIGGAGGGVGPNGERQKDCVVM